MHLTVIVIGTLPNSEESEVTIAGQYHQNISMN